MRLTREQMLSGSDRIFKTIEVEQMGGEIRIASVSALAMLALKELGAADGEVSRALAVIVFSSSIVDDAGESMLSEEEASTVLGRISAEAMGLVVSEVFKLGSKKKAANGVAPGAVVAEANPSKAALSDASPTA